MENQQAPNLLANLKNDLLNAKGLLIDVRELDEWEEFHLKSAKLLPVSELELMSQAELKKWLASFGPCDTIYLHCRSGGRASKIKSRFTPLAANVITLSQSARQLASLGIE